MRKSLRTWAIAIVSAAVVVVTGWQTSPAQDVPVPKLDPSACKKIQDDVDQVVKVSQSDSLTDQQKVAILSETWAKSLAAMQNQAKNDDEMNKMVKELSASIGRVITLALVPSPSGDKNVSLDAGKALKDLKEHVKPYLAFMRLLCPELKMPSEMSK